MRWHTTLKWHHKATRIKWYKKWHEYRYSHHLHVATAVFVLALIVTSTALNFLQTPKKAFAGATSWSQSTDTQFNTGTYVSTKLTGTGDTSVQLNNPSFSNAGGGTWQYSRSLTVTNPNSTLIDYQVPITPFTDSAFLNNTGLLGSWHFSENTGTIASDSSGNGNTGTLSAASWAAGKAGSGFSSNGSNYISVPDNTSLNVSGNITLEAWVYPTAASNIVRFIALKSDTLGASDWNYSLDLRNYTANGAEASFVIGNASAVQTVISGSDTVSFNTWHHIIGTADGSNVRLYIDNVEKKNVAQTTTITASTTSPLGIGASRVSGVNQNNFVGVIDEVKLYNRSFSNVEVGNRYNSGNPKVKPDYSDLRFTNSDGTTEYNYWMESDSKFYVKAPSLVSGANTLKMHYGNNSATTSSSGTNTFLFFDDFDGAALDTANKWTTNATGSITGTVSNGVYRITGATTSSNTYWIYDNTDTANQHSAKNISSVDNITIEWAEKTENTGDMSQVGLALSDSSNRIRSYLGYADGGGGNGTGGVAKLWIYETTSTQEVATNSEIRTLRMDRSGTTTKYFVDGAHKATGTLTSTPTKLTIGVGTYSGYAFMPLTLDKIRVRTYAASDPSFSIGAESGVGFLTSGSYVSSLIQPTGLYGNWGTLTFSKTTPGDSTLTIDVLDGSDNLISGLNNVVSGTNLNISTAAYPVLKLRANFTASSDGTQTPVLNDWSLGYSVDFTPPTAPSGQSITTTTNSATISWDESSDFSESGIQKYEVQKSTDGTNWDTAVNPTPATNTNYTYDGLNPNTRYYFRVRAVDNVNNASGYNGSASADVNTQALLKFDETTGVKAEDSSLTDNHGYFRDVQLDNMDSALNWGAIPGDMINVNNSVFKEGTGAINMIKAQTSAAETNLQKTISATNMANRYLNFWMYIKDDATRAKISAGEIFVFAPDVSNRKSNSYPNLNVGWNLLTMDISDGTGITGSPNFTNVQLVRVDANTVSAAQTWGQGDVIFDDCFMSEKKIVDGKFGKALSFDGANDHVLIPNSPTLDNSGQVTLEAWIKTSSIASTRIISTDVVASTLLVLKANNIGGSTVVTRAVFRDNNNIGLGINGTIPINDGNWHHLVTTLSGGNINIFVDGQPDGNGTFAPTGNFNPVGPINIGSAPVGEFFEGIIDEVKISSIARSAADIQAYYDEASLTPKSAVTLVTTPSLNTPVTPQSTTKPTVTGTTTPSVTVKLFDNGAEKAITTADGFGNFTFNASTPGYLALTEGNHANITVKAYNAENVATPDSGAVTIYVDGTGPAITSFSVSSNAQFTSSTSVNLALTATDAGSGVSEMQFSNDGQDWSGWENYATTKAWTLSNGDGTKTVFVRVKDNAGNIASFTTTPSGSAVADWQAVSQGNHYGNFYDSVTGTWATVTRVGAKTIYDPLTKRIYDVPTNYLGVNPRSDGKPGSEAVIEEARTNYLTHSSFEADSNQDGLTDNWNMSRNAVAGIESVGLVSENFYGNKAQRFNYVGQPGDVNGTITLANGSAVGTFAAGETAIFSVYLKGSVVGSTARINLKAKNSSFTTINTVRQDVILTNNWERFTLVYPNLPVDTSLTYAEVSVIQISDGDNFDIKIDSAQVEKGSFATSYIPTTTAAVTRNADVVTVPTTSWGPSSGTLFTVANRPLVNGATLVNWNGSPTANYVELYSYNDNRIDFRNTTDGDVWALRPSTAGYGVYAGSYAVGFQSKAYFNGVGPGSPNGGPATISLPSPSNTATIGGARHGYVNSPIQRVLVYSSTLSDDGIAILSNNLKEGYGLINLDTTAPIATTSAIVSPNGNEKWKGGTSQTITWNPSALYDEGSGLDTTPIKLEYTTNGTDYTQIATNEANDGTFTWSSIPTIDSSTVKIRITVSDGVTALTATDVSDANFTIDSTGPTGTVTVNSTNFTNSNIVTLNLSATDAGSGVGELRFSNSGNVLEWSTWEGFVDTKPGWDLSDVTYGGTTGQGSKTIYVEFKDTTGNTSTVNDSIFWDEVTPSNPSSVTGPGASNSWGDDSTPTFNWSGAADPGVTDSPVTGSDVKDYWVYFGTDQNANPKTVTDETNLAYIDNNNSNNYTPTSYTVASGLTSGQTYYLKVRSRDNALNDGVANYIEGHNLFIYKFDNTAPSSVSYVTPTPAGWSTTDPYSFSWPQAIDAGSGVAGYEYKRDNADEWTFTTNLSVSGINHYQSGVNRFLIRVKDNAGNYSTVIPTNYYFAGNIGAPENLAADLSQSQNQTVNSFKFTWDAPDGVIVAAYHYSVNSAPNTQNTTRTTNAYTPFYAAGKQQGLNTFYVVTEDADGNIGWTNAAQVNFTINSVEPVKPTTVSITDSSNRSTNQYALTLMWVPASENTPDFSHYLIERSTDGNNYFERATLEKTNTGYLDTGLTQGQRYYYRIKSKDSVGKLSAATNAVDKVPTGKFTTPPTFTSNPIVNTKALSVIINWTTNRPSNTIVQYGPSTSYGQEASKSTEVVTDHSIEILGLTPGTTYHFRAQSLDADRDYDPSVAFSEDYTFTTLAAPGISNVEISEIRLSSAIITWKTTSSATSKIHYGKTTGYGKAYVDNSASQTTTHTVKMENLTDSTTYHFKITGTDVDGNTLSSDDYVFTTLTFPKLSNLKVGQVPNTPTSTVEVKFDSNVPTSSQIVVTGKGGKEVAKYDLETTHVVKVTGLSDNTQYTISAKGRDQYGNEASAVSTTYKTDFDTRPPLTSDITVESSIVGYGVDAKGQLVISWNTDEPASSQVEYGSGIAGDYTSKTQEDTSLTENHVVIISDLKASSPYHFRVISKDNSGNSGISGDNPVLTEQATESVIDLIIKSLQSSIGWIFTAFVKN